MPFIYKSFLTCQLNLMIFLILGSHRGHPCPWNDLLKKSHGRLCSLEYEAPTVLKGLVRRCKPEVTYTFLLVLFFCATASTALHNVSVSFKSLNLEAGSLPDKFLSGLA